MSGLKLLMSCMRGLATGDEDRTYGYFDEDSTVPAFLSSASEEKVQSWPANYNARLAESIAVPLLVGYSSGSLR